MSFQQTMVGIVGGPRPAPAPPFPSPDGKRQGGPGTAARSAPRSGHLHLMEEDDLPSTHPLSNVQPAPPSAGQLLL